MSYYTYCRHLRSGMQHNFLIYFGPRNAILLFLWALERSSGAFRLTLTPAWQAPKLPGNQVITRSGNYKWEPCSRQAKLISSYRIQSNGSAPLGQRPYLALTLCWARAGPAFFGGASFFYGLCWPKKAMRYDITAMETEKLHILS